MQQACDPQPLLAVIVETHDRAYGHGNSGHPPLVAGGVGSRISLRFVATPRCA